ncbi:MAG: hypothetical protein IEMM0003_0194 [bacterium]|nr:MAG: hypothetical protein IEMM0003_0194 [bacterium]
MDLKEYSSSSSNEKLLRLLDANFNRAREGLRVIEDIHRFCYKNQQENILILKKFRHNLAECEKEYRIRLPLLQSRDTENDCGTKITLKDEISRNGLSDVAAGNFKRIEESLRVIEEIGKLLLPKLTIKIKSLRYGCYEIEKSLAKEDK